MTPHIAVPVADLWTVLNQDAMHSHQRPGIWDDSNRPEIAGKPCEQCAARARLMVALGDSCLECGEEFEPGDPVTLLSRWGHDRRRHFGPIHAGGCP